VATTLHVVPRTSTIQVQELSLGFQPVFKPEVVQFARITCGHAQVTNRIRMTGDGAAVSLQRHGA
jgi:hypothetical protein